MRLLVSKTPVRLSMGGGGTDVQAYYAKHGGFWTSAAITRYVNLTVNTRIDNSYHIKYSFSDERVHDICEIQNALIKHSLLHLGFDKWEDRYNQTRGLEINVISDVPSHSGLGVSGCITVGLLQILHQLKGDVTLSNVQLAEEAYYVEHDLVGSESTGKQDQYIACCGGITSFDIEPDGRVTIHPIKLERHTIAELENNLLLVGTRLRRLESANEALKAVTEHLKEPSTKTAEAIIHPKPNKHEEYLHRIKEIGHDQRKALLLNQPNRFGELLDDHWKVKLDYSGATDETIETFYEETKKVGVIGGKVIGASSKGSFMVLYCPNDKANLRKVIAGFDLIEIPWTLEYSGSRITHID